MTVGFFPAFDPRITVTFEGDGASLFHAAAALDALAEVGEPDAIPALETLADRFPDVAFIRFAVDAAIRRIRG